MAKRIKNYHGLEGEDKALSERQHREKLEHLAARHSVKPYMANLFWAEINSDWVNTPQKTKDIVKILGL